MSEEIGKSSQEPDLELPSLPGFGRRKKRRAADQTEAETTAPVRPSPAPASAPSPQPSRQPSPPPVSEPVLEPPPDRARRTLTLPVVDPRLAAAATGALAGLVGVVLASLTGRGCEQVRGVGSCGAFGLIALLLIVAIMVVLGATVLKAWRIHDPVSTSFLGVGLVAVFVMLFLLNSLESVWMLLVVPVLGALTFMLSWWVTDTFVEDNSGTR